LRVLNQEVKILKDIVNETSMSDKAASIISEYTGIEKKKIQFFIEEVGLNCIFENPSLICMSEEEKERLGEMKIILEGVVKPDGAVQG
jgi:hypothetical protein